MESGEVAGRANEGLRTGQHKVGRDRMLARLEARVLGQAKLGRGCGQGIG